MWALNTASRPQLVTVDAKICQGKLARQAGADLRHRPLVQGREPPCRRPQLSKRNPGQRRGPRSAVMVPGGWAQYRGLCGEHRIGVTLATTEAKRPLATRLARGLSRTDDGVSRGDRQISSHGDGPAAARRYAPRATKLGIARNNRRDSSRRARVAQDTKKCLRLPRNGSGASGRMQEMLEAFFRVIDKMMLRVTSRDSGMSWTPGGGAVAQRRSDRDPAAYIRQPLGDALVFVGRVYNPVRSPGWAHRAEFCTMVRTVGCLFT